MRREAAQNRRFPVLPHPPHPRNNLKTLLTALEKMFGGICFATKNKGGRGRRYMYLRPVAHRCAMALPGPRPPIAKPPLRRPARTCNQMALKNKVKGIPKWFFGQVIFWRPGVPRPKTTHSPEKPMVFGPCHLRRQCTKTTCFWKTFSGRQKNTWPTKTLRDPFDKRDAAKAPRHFLRIRPEFPISKRLWA